jgi:hypothetical protein
MTGQILGRDKVEALLPPPFLMLVQCLPDLNSIRRRRRPRLDATTAPAARPASTVMRNRSHILNPANPKTLTGQHSNRSLRTGTRSPSLMPTRRPNTNMETGNALVLSHLRSGGSCLHSRVRGPLQTISLDMLAPGTPRNRLGTRQISNVNHRIVETGIDMGDTPAINLLSLFSHTNYPEKPAEPCARI